MGNESSQQSKLGDALVNDIAINWKKGIQNTNVNGIEGHCAAQVGAALFVFGGVVSGSDGDMFESNHLFKYDHTSRSWSKVECNGDVPAPRAAATMSAVDNKLYLIGGVNQGVGWFNDLHVFDIESKTWSKVEIAGTTFAPRDKLASTAIGKNVYIFGGFGPQDSGDIDEEEGEDDEDWEDEEVGEQEGAQFGWFNDLYIFNTEDNSLSQPMQMNLGVPTPRAAHAMCAVEKFLVIFGGRDAVGRKNDIYIFDTETRKWVTDLSVSGRKPSERSFHSLTTVEKRVVLFGGRDTANRDLNDLHIFDTKTRQWLQPKIEGDETTGRGAHIAGIVNDQFLIHGGSSQFNPETMQCANFHNDTFTIPIDEITREIKTRQNTDDDEPSPKKSRLENADVSTAD